VFPCRLKTNRIGEQQPNGWAVFMPRLLRFHQHSTCLTAAQTVTSGISVPHDWSFASYGIKLIS
jgi:hypothetical protein